MLIITILAAVFITALFVTVKLYIQVNLLDRSGDLYTIDIRLKFLGLTLFHTDQPNDKKKRKRKNKPNYTKLLIEIAKRTSIDELNIRSSIGLYDSFYTVICAGILYSVCGTFLTIANSISKLKKGQVDIDTKYNEIVLTLTIDCIISFKAGQIIYAVIIFLLKKKGKKSNGKSSNK